MAVTQTRAEDDVLAERQRQTTVEGHLAHLDDEHRSGELALAASYYAINSVSDLLPIPNEANVSRKWILKHYANACWPWNPEERKPKDRRRDLVRAAALLIAEIDRIDRQALQD